MSLRDLRDLRVQRLLIAIESFTDTKISKGSKQEPFPGTSFEIFGTFVSQSLLIAIGSFTDTKGSKRSKQESFPGMSFAIFASFVFTLL